MLEGLGDIDWSALSHAYGPAVDTPDRLRQAGSDDSETASEALAELYASIFHQGSVYSATPAAVPFLVELASVAPHRRAEVVWMIGMLADEQHAYGSMRPVVRAAVQAHSEALVALLDDEDARVREAAAYAACRAAAEVEAFWTRWSTEDDPRALASLVLALAERDIAHAAPVLGDAMRNAQPTVRVAAAIALLRAGVEWPDGGLAALVEAIDEGATLAYGWNRGQEWNHELLEATGDAVAASLLERMLRSSNPATRCMGVWGLAGRCDLRRSVPPALAPMLNIVIDDADVAVRSAVIGALRRAGASAGRYADVLAELAAGYPEVAGQQSITLEYQAIRTLAMLGDPRWVAPVCAAAVTAEGIRHGLRGARFTHDVLNEVRRCLAAQPASADALAAVIAGWGVQAVAAGPELRGALSLGGTRVVAALLALGIDEPDALPQLRSLVTEQGDLAAALAIHRIVGDATPLLDTVREWLARKRFVPHENRAGLAAISALGGQLGPLLPAAEPLLTGVAAPSDPERQVQLLAARIVAATSDAASIVPTVQAVLAGGRTPARAAADLVADLAGTHPWLAAQCASLLWDRLDDRWSRLAAARALTRLGTPVAELTTPLVKGLTDYAGRFGVATILELRAVETAPYLEELLAADARFQVTGLADELVWADEILQEQVRAAIVELRQRGAGRS